MLLCFGLLFYNMSKFQPSFSHWTDLALEYFGIWFMIDSMMSKCLGSGAAKQPKIITPSNTVLDSWYEVYVQIYFYVCVPCLCLFGRLFQRTLFHKPCNLFRRDFANLNCVSTFSLESKRSFPVATFPDKPYLFSLFQIFLLFTLPINRLIESCRVLDVVCCSFS